MHLNKNKYDRSSIQNLILLLTINYDQTMILFQIVKSLSIRMFLNYVLGVLSLSKTTMLLVF